MEKELKRVKYNLELIAVMLIYSSVFMLAWNYTVAPSLGFGDIVFWQAFLFRMGVQSLKSARDVIDRIKKREALDQENEPK